MQSFTRESFVWANYPHTGYVQKSMLPFENYDTYFKWWASNILAYKSIFYKENVNQNIQWVKINS